MIADRFFFSFLFYSDVIAVFSVIGMRSKCSAAQKMSCREWVGWGDGRYSGGKKHSKFSSQQSGQRVILVGHFLFLFH
jgi:hypothetical protein